MNFKFIFSDAFKTSPKTQRKQLEGKEGSNWVLICLVFIKSRSFQARCNLQRVLLPSSDVHVADTEDQTFPAVCQ
jgi:hypothetical protein